MDASQKRPMAGVRYAVERSDGDGNVVIYSGFAHIPDADIPLVVRVEHDEAEGKTNVVAKMLADRCQDASCDGVGPDAKKNMVRVVHG
jgi:hypothetical protein